MPKRALMAGISLGMSMAVAVGAAGCGKSKSNQSLSDRVTTGSICVKASTDVKTAGAVAVKLASGSEPVAQAKTDLQPVQTAIAALGQQNANLPIGPKLTALGQALNGVLTLNSTNPGDFVTPAQAVSTAAKDVVTGCAGVITG